MGRKVFITSEMSSDDKLIDIAEQNSEAAILWPWFLTFFDDWARAEASPKKLKAKVFPMIPSVTVELIEESLRLYDQFGLIKLYEVNGKSYMTVPNLKTWYRWQTHIRTSKRDKDESRIPPPPKEDTRKRAQVREGERICTPSPSPSPSPSSDLSVVVSKDQQLHKGEESERPAAAAATTDENLIILQKSLQKGGILAPSGFEIEQLLKWHDEGMEIDAITYAIEKAALAGKRRVDYVVGILKGWSENGIYTKLQALEADKKYELQKAGQTRQRGDPGGEQTRFEPEKAKKREFIRSLYV